MENTKKITAFPKNFFKLKRKRKTLDEALKDTIPFEWIKKKDIKKKKRWVINSFFIIDLNLYICYINH